jgi:hypothetical protein
MTVYSCSRKAVKALRVLESSSTRRMVRFIDPIDPMLVYQWDLNGDLNFAMTIFASCPSKFEELATNILPYLPCAATL